MPNRSDTVPTAGFTRRDVWAALATEVHAGKGAEQAVFGRLAHVEIETDTSAHAELVEVVPLLLKILILGLHVTTDAQAGVGARDEEVACPVGGADPDVIDRRGLPHGKIRSLCPGHRSKTCG